MNLFPSQTARWGALILGSGLLNASLAVGAPLAELPPPGGYTSPVRIALILVAILPWLAFCQWVAKDTVCDKRRNRELWNGVVLGGGAVGLVVWLMLPWKTPGLFAAGFGLWFLITAGTCAIYVIMRNGMVDVNARVFTPRHIKSKLAGMGRKKDEGYDAVERVRLTAHDNKKVTVPTDPTQVDPYEAAQTLLFDALWRRATEVEMVVSPNAVKLVYLVDGVPTPRHDLIPRENAELALNFLKGVAGVDVNERRKPQQGSFSAAISGTKANMTAIKVATSGTTQGERLNLKIVGDAGLHRKLTKQGTALISRNIRKLIDLQPDVRFRMVIVPGYNDRERDIRAAAEYLKSLGHSSIELLKYHNMYEDKARRMGLKVEPLNITPEQSLEAVKRAVELFESSGIRALCRELEASRNKAVFSQRVYDIQNAIRQSDRHLCFEVSRLKTDFYKKHGFSKPVHIHRAERLDNVLKNKTVIINPHELLEGNFTSTGGAGQVWE